MQPNEIVTVNVSVTSAPTPSELQKTGAFVSQGGTTNAIGSLTLLTSVSDLAAMLTGAKTLTTLTYSSGTNTVTGTVSGGHNLTVGAAQWVTVAGCTPAGYNGTFLATVPDSTTFTYAMPTSLATCTVLGKVTDEDVAELNAMNTTFWANGKTTAVYVLELGDDSIANGVSALNTWIGLHPLTVYAFLVPKTWDAESTFKTMCGNYNASDALTYFFVTTTISTYSTWGGIDKCVMAMVEAPLTPVTEFSIAAVFHRILSNSPSSGSPVRTIALMQAFGVTPYPLFGNKTLLQSLRNANIGYFDTGSEGGLASILILKFGHMLSGESFDKWYEIDWSKINLELDLANEVINGNNNTIAPLKYNQQGIDRLQARGADTLRRGIIYGLLLSNLPVKSVQLQSTVFATNVVNGLYAGQIVINAIPFATYTHDNPSDYSQGKYGGLQAVIIPQLGFEQIIVNLNATDFAG